MYKNYQGAIRLVEKRGLIVKARKIYLRSHSDELVGDTKETKAVIIGVLTSGGPQSPITFDDMMKGKPILDAIESCNKKDAAGKEYICITEEQWVSLVQKTKAFSYATGGRAMLAAAHDIIDAAIVTMDERDTNP